MPDEDLRPRFTFSASDPLAAEHEAVTRWVSDALEAQRGRQYWQDVDLKTLESGRTLLEAKPEQARRIVLAALAQAQFFSDRKAEVRATASSDVERANMHRNSAWARLSAVQRPTVSVISALIRRSIPFERDDFALLLGWCIGAGAYEHIPGGFVVKALQRYIAGATMDGELQSLAAKYAETLRSSWDKQDKRWGTELEQLINGASTGIDALTNSQTRRPPPEPSAAGHPLVLRQLKSIIGIPSLQEAVPTAVVGLDRFEMPIHSPLSNAHEWLNQYLTEKAAAPRGQNEMRQLNTGQAMLGMDAEQRAPILLAAAERHIATLCPSSRETAGAEDWRAHYAIAGAITPLADSLPQFDRNLLFDFLLYLAFRPQGGRISAELDKALFEGIKELTGDGSDLTEGERYVLSAWRRARIAGPPMGINSPDIAQLTRWIGDGAKFFLVPGEYWSDAVNEHIAAQSVSSRENWVALLRHALGATTARPSDRWRKNGGELVAKIGALSFREAIEAWLPLVAKGRAAAGIPAYAGDTRGGADSIHDENANALRGLLWLIPQLPGREDLTRLVASVALTAYKKVPGVGPRAVKVGNAAVYCLSQMVSPGAMGQLAMLKVRVRFGTAQKEVEKAFDAAAVELNLPRDQIEEMSVPACGLEDVGMRVEVLGRYRAQLAVTGSKAELQWFDAQDKQLKSMPASVKSENAETVKELQADLKDIQSMLSAQRDRIDGLFLAQKSWPVGIWRERYIDHPLVGTIARRLIWIAADTPVLVVDGVVADVNGHTVDLPPDSLIRLWHPVERTVEEVLALRRRIESLGIVQPFKQAHREVYLLTDAERETAAYSNRFAAHILRQHQFNALCGARQWRNKLRLMVDDEYPPATRELPNWNLRAEFWIEGVGDEYGRDTNESGAFLRLVTDQVRFYKMNAATNSAHAGGGGYRTRAGGPGEGNVNEPVPLEEIPVLVLSEVMRDVDLFVGVASVGNDPTWQDGGPDGRYIEYWRSYSFGELSATAVSRREALDGLIPRLKIAKQCSLTDKFLVVKGSRRTYKIHLGSGNILMEPNDQYLCIVPDAHARMSSDPVYLPFEGDSTLSIILSKAFLLSDDQKIKDAIINRQIDGR